jgi:hypothetical protein
MKLPSLHFRLGFLILLTVGLIAARPNPHVQTFDLVCQLHSRFVREYHPENEDIWAMPTDSWRGGARFAVDLKSLKMRDVSGAEYCAKHVCNSLKKTSDMKIARFNHDYIFVSSHPFRRWSIRRRDGWFESHYVVSAYRTQLTTGTCRKAKFSGFPVLRQLMR